MGSSTKKALGRYKARNLTPYCQSALSVTQLNQQIQQRDKEAEYREFLRQQQVISHNIQLPKPYRRTRDQIVEELGITCSRYAKIVCGRSWHWRDERLQWTPQAFLNESSRHDTYRNALTAQAHRGFLKHWLTAEQYNWAKEQIYARYQGSRSTRGVAPGTMGEKTVLTDYMRKLKFQQWVSEFLPDREACEIWVKEWDLHRYRLEMLKERSKHRKQK